ncbi:hypothetical protein [Rickettsia oklahomensis]|uniref:Uncharacterized protein n=1 Tax=Rickettsia oklahomensis TaxID=3141789 RepID=A0AAU7BYS3_9RICK
MKEEKVQQQQATVVNQSLKHTLTMPSSTGDDAAPSMPRISVSDSSISINF